MAETKQQSGRSDLITIETAATLLELTPQRVNQLVASGHIQKPKRGHTTIVSAVRGYIRFLKEENAKTTKSAAASRAVDARAAEIELRMAERRRELIPQEDAIMAMDLLVGEVASQLSGLGARVTRDIPTRRKIEAAVNETQGNIAKALASGKFFVATGRETSNADPEDNA